MRKFLALLITFLLIAALSWLLPERHGVPYPKPLGPQLSPYARQSYRLDIEARQPDLVLLGDSLLQLGVDGVALADKLGRPVYRITVPGSASAAWYLIARHNIVTATTPPQMLIIFFRDSLLTAPGYRVHGNYYTDIVYENTAPDDSLFIQYSFIDLMSPAERLAEQYLPLYGQRLDVREAIDYRLRYTPPGLALACNMDCTNLAMDNVFNANNLETGTLSDAVAAAESYLYTPDNLDFNSRIEHSFLPEIIRLTRERGIRLVLVRFKTLIFPDAASQPADLQAYMRDLRDYLAANDVPLLDYSGDTRIRADFYFDPFHMTTTGQAIFTEILAADLQPLLDEIP